MDKLRRLPVKTVRDYIKRFYKSKDCCYICGDSSNLELHHLYSVSELFNNWCDEQGIKELTSTDLIMKLRIQFYKDCYNKLNNDNLVTLCKSHHIRLHTIYGQRYSNNLVPKVVNWLEIQKEKHGK